jgi:hypothetical protein
VNYLPGLAWNLNLPDFCLLSSEDYRHESLVPSFPVSLSLHFQSFLGQIKLLSNKLVSFSLVNLHLLEGLAMV